MRLSATRSFGTPLLGALLFAVGVGAPSSLLGALVAAPVAPMLQATEPAPAPGDTVAEPVEIRNLPGAPNPTPARWATGIWEWDREGLQTTRALTLLELLQEIPGVTPLRGGDYGQPASVTAFGVGGGRVRIHLDGVELPPLMGGVADLSRLGLGGFDRVRVERRTGELRVELFSLEMEDPRPRTLIEVGTGDLNTNLFRGTFAHPTALGGNIVVSLDRIDTEGPQSRESGASFGAHLRHTLHLWDRGGIAWEFRRMTARRPETLWSPPTVHRTDIGVHGRLELGAGILASAFFQRSSLGADYGRDAPEPEAPEVNEDPRSQAGLRLSIERERWWGEATGFQGWGEGWLSSGLGLRAGGTFPGIGGAEVSMERQGWRAGGEATGLHGRVWTEPRFGLSLFGEAEDGSRGIASWIRPVVLEEPPEGEEPPEVPEAPPLSFSERRGMRGGIEFRRGDFHLAGAAVRIEADSLHPMGTEAETDSIVTPGGVRNGFEVAVHLPLGPIMNGLALSGTAQLWDETERWRYLPQRSYEGAFRYQNTFLESRNLEIWTDIGVRGRDPMVVPLADGSNPLILAEVPFQQSWFARLQIRVVSVRIFILWENVTVRDQNQDYPGRLLPATRALYGVRWTLWN